MPSLGVPAFVVYRVDQDIIINVLVDCLDFVSCCIHAHRMHLPYVLFPSSSIPNYASRLLCPALSQFRLVIFKLCGHMN